MRTGSICVSALRALVLAHHLGKALEQIMAVAWSGRRLGMVLHREYRLVLERDAAVRAVEQRHVGLHRVGRESGAVDGEAVVHGGDLDLARDEVLHRMVGAVMPLM